MIWVVFTMKLCPVLMCLGNISDIGMIKAKAPLEIAHVSKSVSNQKVWKSIILQWLGQIVTYKFYVVSSCLYIVCTIFAQYLCNICAIFAQYLYNIWTIFVKYLHIICTIFGKYWNILCTILAQYLYNI